MGSAPASGAVFRALAEKPRGPQAVEGSFQCCAQAADLEACSAMPGAGMHFKPSRIFPDHPWLN
jgi:hypothetical protein